MLYSCTHLETVGVKGLSVTEVWAGVGSLRAVGGRHDVYVIVK